MFDSGNRRAPRAWAHGHMGTWAAASGLSRKEDAMQIQINTDHHIDGSEARNAWARGVIEGGLAPWADQLSRVEVHFNVENAGHAGTGGLRCLIEARPNFRAPVAANHHADAFDAALNGALHKLLRALEHAKGRVDRHAHDERALPVEGASSDDFVSSAEPF
jgi:hypothetical protein